MERFPSMCSTPKTKATIKVFQFGVYRPESGCGVNQYLYQNTNLLRHELDMHFINFDQVDQDAYYKERKQGVTIHHFAYLKMMGMRFPQRFYRWLDEMSQEDNCIFHLHSVFRISNYKFSKILKEKNIPYIFTPHDSYSSESLQKKKWLKLVFLKTLEGHILKNASMVHAISNQGVEDIRRFTDNKISMVTNFVPDYSRDFVYPRKRHICFVGRFDIYQKGIDQQLKAYQLFQRHSSIRIPMVMIGRHSAQDLRTVRNLIQDMQLDPGGHIQIPGRVSDRDKYRYLRDSYVYMQLSRYEGFGLSIVEALSMHKPVIISDKVPIKDRVLEHEAGFVVSNYQEAAEALFKIYSMGPEEYARMARQARKCYEQCFHPEIIKPQLLDMYREVAPQPSSRA